MIFSLQVRDLRKRYGDFEAVRGVSFSVRRGSCFGILGPNAAGKTSLLGMIEGITPITSGSISLLGMDVATQIQQIQPRVGVQLQQVVEDPDSADQCPRDEHDAGVVEHQVVAERQERQLPGDQVGGAEAAQRAENRFGRL